MYLDIRSSQHGVNDRSLLDWRILLSLSNNDLCVNRQSLPKTLYMLILLTLEALDR
jgi:hypothetical protein